jgi:predicted enzyme related to lactoylglutathione lyase
MGRVVHFEIHAENPQRAIEFYKNIFGWQFQKWEGPMEYWLITTGENDTPGINGGLMKRQGSIDGKAVIAYVCTVDVESVDEAQKKIEKNNGVIVVPKVAIPGMGWYFYAKDTEGNIFGCMQNDQSAK